MEVADHGFDQLASDHGITGGPHVDRPDAVVVGGDPLDEQAAGFGHEATLGRLPSIVVQVAREHRSTELAGQQVLHPGRVDLVVTRGEHLEDGGTGGRGESGQVDQPSDSF